VRSIGAIATIHRLPDLNGDAPLGHQKAATIEPFCRDYRAGLSRGKEWQHNLNASILN
jgi:hypothetical protein